MADIINICFQKKEHFAFFFYKGSNLFKFMTASDGLTERISFFFFDTGTLLQLSQSKKYQNRQVVKMLPTL